MIEAIFTIILAVCFISMTVMMAVMVWDIIREWRGR